MSPEALVADMEPNDNLLQSQPPSQQHNKEIASQNSIIQRR